ncbi:phosphatidylserine decarboxylase-domain-containing protein [Schizophyllum amplum]|uniref:Phosphatidylserine decarboxylase proenzyme 2 n=1 Tax=Schizophyllum amplum TaxID=97359 RepID=A0A550BS63_9AGAR|nr:phosphatidylserine decarboxylase-domain-containing protein [Auriculariopsis ampla]
MSSTPTAATPNPTKGKKFKRAIKSAARLPRPGKGLRGRGGRGSFAPIPGETPIVNVRVQVVGCSGLIAKDRNGYSDPFVTGVRTFDPTADPVAKRTLNPTYPAKDATFDFPIYLSLADRLGALELVIWDKDMLKKDYIGEAALPLDDWFANGRGFGFTDPSNVPFTVNLVSTRTSTQAKGSVELKVGFVSPPHTHNLLEFPEVFEELVRRARRSLVSAPPTEGVGTIRRNEGGPEYEDDGGLSSSSEDDDSDDEDTDVFPTTPSTPGGIYDRPPAELLVQARKPSGPHVAPRVESPKSEGPPTPRVDVQPASPQMPNRSPSSRASLLPKILRRSSGTSSDGLSSSPSPLPSPAIATPSTPSSSLAPSTPTTPVPGGRRRRREKGGSYNLSKENDIVGIVMLEIDRAEDLPKLKNMTRTGWDMDPFVVVSFGKKVFRTRVIRHSLNPIWDEKLLFHVRRYEKAFRVKLTLLDWDKMSSNDLIGETGFEVADLLAKAPSRTQDGLYKDELVEFKLNIATDKNPAWEARHNPIITVRAKYQPYDALRQRFWRQYLRQYDTDDTGSLSHVEYARLPRSTLTRTTVDSFFTRYGKKPHEDELLMDEVVQCLEDEIGKPDAERQRVGEDADEDPNTSAIATPVLGLSDAHGRELDMSQLDFSGPPAAAGATSENTDAPQPRVSSQPGAPAGYATEPAAQPLVDAAAFSPTAMTYSSSEDAGEESSSSVTAVGGKKKRRGFKSRASFRKSSSSKSSSSSPDALTSGSRSPDGMGSGGMGAGSVERVINVKNCPLCHRPRLNDKAEMDIVTHLAVCASQDWNKVDRIMVANFVTASQAQRKWYTKIIGKISSGDYKLGANSANIIVQNRMTGQLEEEKMAVYVRLGIRLLYKGAKSRMEGGRARRLLKSMSIKQGIKYDSPESVRDIVPFIEFHQLKIEEMLDPVDSFSASVLSNRETSLTSPAESFNEFFYRKLKPSARPVEALDDPYRLVSAADCRLMTFETVSDATKLWIKGREFTVGRLLGDNYKEDFSRYEGGALAIFRLAPQDYHRFHTPVDGKIGKMSYIAGEYYTVNPQAIRTSLDVYGENARMIVPIDSPQFGRVMAVCVGAMMVGTIKITVEEGQEVKRGDEFGYFAFGGSTIVLLIEKGAVQWDEDLLINGRSALETLVRVGMGIGKGLRAEQV